MKTLPPHLERPRLRPVDAVTTRDSRGRDVVVLRDGEGVSPCDLPLPGALAVLASRMNGARDLAEIARGAAVTMGLPVDPADVLTLARHLDEALMLESPAYRQRRREQVEDFARLRVRRAHHAGGAYPGRAAELRRYIETECFGSVESAHAPGRVTGLCAPHMDFWRASRGYGHAYGALRRRLSEEIDTVIVLGTCHAGMGRPFAVCEKAFDTPLGPVEVDRRLVAELARGSRFDIREEEYMHKIEHSIEFQVVFLKHLLGARTIRLVPILCGLGESQGRRRDPREDASAESFLQALAQVVADLGPRALVVAGADLAHVGPRFGDPRALEVAERDALATRDGASVRYAVDRDAGGFYAHTVEDLHSRRVCGVGPVYTLLRALGAGAPGELLHYEQCVDPDEGSIVSHASILFTG